jgi:hypothetical protein
VTVAELFGIFLFPLICCFVELAGAAALKRLPNA